MFIQYLLNVHAVNFHHTAVVLVRNDKFVYNISTNFLCCKEFENIFFLIIIFNRHFLCSKEFENIFF